MSSGDLFGKISLFVEAHLSETGRDYANNLMGPKYVFEHSLRVAFWCWRLALETHADVSMCVAAGLLHDVSRFESENPNAQTALSAETAKKYMTNEGYKKEFTATIVDAIENQIRQGMPARLEARILQDADRLDEFGYVRLLCFMKTVGESFSQYRGNAKSLLAEIGKIEKDEYSQMWTSMGKARMKTQLTMYKTFLNGLLEEIENTETTMR